MIQPRLDMAAIQAGTWAAGTCQLSEVQGRVGAELVPRHALDAGRRREEHCDHGPSGDRDGTGGSSASLPKAYPRLKLPVLISNLTKWQVLISNLTHERPST